MTAFARQLRGRMELAANASGGVTARLTFPTPAIGSGGRRRARPRQARGNRVAA